MTLFMAVLAAVGAVYALFWRDDYAVGIAFLAWGSALMTRYDLEQLKKELARRGDEDICTPPATP